MALLALVISVIGLAGMTLTPERSTAPTTKPNGRAALKIVGTQPLAVTGLAFKSRERVMVSADGRRKTVTAGARGGFKVVFPQANACNGVVVVARGALGSRASISFANFSNVHCLEP